MDENTGAKRRATCAVALTPTAEHGIAYSTSTPAHGIRTGQQITLHLIASAAGAIECLTSRSSHSGDHACSDARSYHIVFELMHLRNRPLHSSDT